jgi:hypothetical protein
MDTARSSSIALAIDTCVSRMNALKRPIARHLLEKGNIPSQTLSVVAKEDGLEFSQGTDPPATCRKDGKVSNWADHDGEVFRSTCQQDGNRWVLVFTGKEGQSRDEYRWSEDGTEIKLEVTVSSPHLPVPLIYLLDYRRKLTPPQEHAPSAPERRSVESGPGKPISEKMSP